MMANSQLQTIDSVAKFTIFSIGRTEVGLEILMQNARQAGCALSNGDVNDGLKTLQSLIGHLYDFRRFIREVSITFSLDLALIRDARGSFEDNADHFRATLLALSAALEEYDTAELSRLLSIDMPASLARFREMLPLLCDRVELDMPGAA